MTRYKATEEANLDQQQRRLFELPEHTNHPDRNHPNHVVVVTWTDGALSILAQSPVNDETDKRVLFYDHVEGRIPALEAFGLARHISKKLGKNNAMMA